MSATIANPERFTQQYEAAIRNAIDSADEPYTPGSIARLYHQTPPHQRESVNQEVNRIFRQHTGITRSLSDSDNDIRFKRQWLRLRDVVVERRLELYGKKTDLRYRWAIYQVDLNRRILEIDVEDRNNAAPVIQCHVTQLVFNRGTVPAGFQLTMTSHKTFDRWTISWQASANLAWALHRQFLHAVVFPGSYGPQWRARSQRDRMARQEEVQRQLEFLRKPNKKLGGRKPAEVMQYKPGNYEIQGQGFITVWKGYIYFHPLSSDKKHNDAIRWFLNRDVSVPMALSINSQQQSGLFKEALAASVLTMKGGLNLQPNGGVNQSLLKQAQTIAGEGRNKMLDALQESDLKPYKGKKVDLVSIVRERVKTTSEREAQSTVDVLAKKPNPNALTLLRPVR